MSVDVLVYCANGLKGQAIVDELLLAGLSVRALVRDVEKASALARSGAQVVSAPLEDPAALEKAHDGVEAALLQLPTGQGPEETRRLGSAAIATIQNAGVKKVIYNPAVQIPRRADALPSFTPTTVTDWVRRHRNAYMAR